MNFCCVVAGLVGMYSENYFVGLKLYTFQVLLFAATAAACVRHHNRERAKLAAKLAPSNWFENRRLYDQYGNYVGSARNGRFYEWAIPDATVIHKNQPHTIIGWELVLTRQNV